MNEYKIAFIAPYNIYEDKYCFSPARILADGLKPFFREVDFISPVSSDINLVEKIRRKIIREFYSKQGITYRFETEYRGAAMLSMKYQKLLKSLKYDAIFSWFTTFDLVNLVHDIPLIIYRDAVFPSLINNYDGFMRIPNQCLIQGKRLEQKTFSHTEMVFFSSKWGINEFKKYYESGDLVKPKLKMVYLGPNLRDIPDSESINKLRVTHSNDICRFFLPVSAKGWVRKGGDKAVEIVKRLNEIGFPSSLFIAGDVPDAYRKNPFIEVLPFLDKQKPKELNIWVENLVHADFLLFPTKADFTPQIIPEANAYGTPVLSTTVGGIPEMILEGSNGYLFSPNAPSDEYINIVKLLRTNQKMYQNLRLTTRRIYDEKFNWDNISSEIAKEIERLINPNSAKLVNISKNDHIKPRPIS